MGSEPKKPSDGTNEISEKTGESGDGANESGSDKLFYIVLWLAVLVFFSLTLLIFILFLRHLSSITSNNSAVTVLSVLKGVPADWKFYAIVALLAGLWACRYFFLKIKLTEKLKLPNTDTQRQGLNDRDWQAYRELRVRAFALRTRAGLILGSVFALLFGGIYFIIFLLPLTEAHNQLLTRQAIHLATFQERYGKKLDDMAKGRFWLQNFRGGSGQSESRFPLVEFSGTVHKSRGSRPRVMTASGRLGVIARKSRKVLITSNEGQAWKPVNLALKEGERIISARFIDNDKRILLVGSKISIFLLSAKMEVKFSSKLTELNLKQDERLRRTRFSNDGKSVLLVGNKGKLFIVSVKDNQLSPKSIDLAQQKDKEVTLKPGEQILQTRFSNNGKSALLVGRKGSVFLVSVNGDQLSRTSVDLAQQKDKEVTLKPGEQILQTRFSNDGKSALLVGHIGSVFLVSVNGDQLSRTSVDLAQQKDKEVTLKPGEQILQTRFSNDGKSALLVGRKGSVFWVFVNGDQLSRTSVDLAQEKDKEVTLIQDEHILLTRFSNDGKSALLVGPKGKVFLVSVKNNQLSLVSRKLNLSYRFWNLTVTISKNGAHGLIADDEGSIFIMTRGDNINIWERLEKLKLKHRERVIYSLLNNDGKKFLMVGNKGSVFKTEDGGKFWNTNDVRPKQNESISRVIISKQDTHGLIIGNASSVFTTKDGGQSWEATQWDGLGSESIYTVKLSPIDSSHFALAVGSQGNTYLLKKHPDMGEWRNWELEEVEKKLKRNELVRNSKIFQDVKAFLAKAGYLGSNKDDKNESTNDFLQDSIGINLDRLNLKQLVTMTVLFFLVQLLVSLYKYNMRLANFWDSRADAVLLEENFSTGKAHRFDNLVQALAPDAYDFKPMPRSLFGWSPSRRD